MDKRCFETREKWEYNFILNNFMCQKNKFLLLLLSFHVFLLSFLDAEKTHFWDFLISLKIVFHQIQCKTFEAQFT